MSVESTVHCYCRTGYGVLVEVGNPPGAPGVPPCVLKPLGGLRGGFTAGAQRVLGMLAHRLATVRKGAA